MIPPGSPRAWALERYMTGTEASQLVNAVSAFALVLSGLLALALAFMMTRQPWRWLLVYLCVAVAGVATVWYHGFGEPFPARVAEMGASLLLAWMIQVAIVGDFYPGRGGRLLNLVLFLANLEYIMTLAIGGAKAPTPLVLALSQFGGLNFGELLLIVNCLVAVILLYGRRREVQPEARPILSIVTLLFFAGLLLSIAWNSWGDFGILAFRATCLIVGAFGFIALWAFNEMRFSFVPSYVEEAVPAVAPAEEEPEVIFSPEGEILVRPGYAGGWARAGQR